MVRKKSDYELYVTNTLDNEKKTQKFETYLGEFLFHFIHLSIYESIYVLPILSCTRSTYFIFQNFINFCKTSCPNPT